MRTVAHVHAGVKHVLANLRLGLIHAIPVLMIIMTALPSAASHTSCSDGIDNDQDGRIDYPQDTQCVSLEDDSEGATGQGVFISVTDGKDTVKPGGSLIYRITLTSDRQAQQEVDVRFHMPHQTNFLSASNGGHVVGSYVQWEKVTIQRGTQRFLTVNMELDPYAQEGLLIVSKVEAGGETATDTTRVTGAITQQSPLKLSITDDRVTAKPRDVLHYRIRAENVGTGDRTFNLRATLPVQLEFISASGGYEKQSHTLEWRNQTLNANESREYTFDGKIEDHLTGFFALSAKAFITNTNEKASDSTIVHIGPMDSDFGVTVKADKQEVEREQTVTYEITVTNKSSDLATQVNVTDSLPYQTEFVSATEGGRFTGANEVRWDGLTISPKGHRVLSVTARVRSNAEIGSTLINSVFVKNHRANVTTQLVVDAKNVSSSSRSGRASDNVFLRKTADRSEVTPGDTIAYTVTLRNTTGKTLRNLEVVDRLDATYMALESGAGDDAKRIGNRLTWTVASLAPNEVWQRTYTVVIAANAPGGLTLSNIVTVGGDDISSVSLTERVQTAELDVVGELPQTGAGMDTIFVTLSGMFGALQLILQRRKILA